MLSPAGGDEDGAMYASQIERLHLKADLVVLAACDSATGVQLPGAGVTGLAAAFLGAGAHAVVATQWAVPDADAARFFVEFHRRYTLGGDPVSALRDTQLWARQQRMPPSIWAAVISIERAT
jgi:CHAT domain-containing protein